LFCLFYPILYGDITYAVITTYQRVN